MSRERHELPTQPEQELAELTTIYVGRGLPVELAQQGAMYLNAGDALAAHARDELGVSEHTSARPIQAALTSAATFAVGAALPLAAVAVSPSGAMVPTVSGASLAFLALLGAIAAKAGGAGLWKPTARVTFWGALAMAITAVIGSLFGAVVQSGTGGANAVSSGAAQLVAASIILVVMLVPMVKIGCGRLGASARGDG